MVYPEIESNSIMETYFYIFYPLTIAGTSIEL